MHRAESQEREMARDQWYRWMVQSAVGYGIFSVDLNNRIVTWDAGAEGLFGYQRHDVMGEDARFIFTPEDVENRIPEAELAGAAQDRCAPDERWHVKKDGTVFWASGFMIRIFDDQRKHVGFVKIVRELAPGKSG